MDPAHATRTDLDVDGSIISHLTSAWSRDTNTFSSQYCVRWNIRSSKMDNTAAKDVWPILYWLTWKPLLPLIDKLHQTYYWIDHFARYETSGSILAGQFLYVWNLVAWYMGRLVHYRHYRRVLNLPVALFMAYLATLIHVVAVYHLVFSVPVRVDNYERLWSIQGYVFSDSWISSPKAISPIGNSSPVC